MEGATGLPLYIEFDIGHAMPKVRQGVPTNQSTNPSARSFDAYRRGKRTLEVRLKRRSEVWKKERPAMRCGREPTKDFFVAGRRKSLRLMVGIF